jgi:hypothetical protein
MKLGRALGAFLLSLALGTVWVLFAVRGFRDLIWAAYLMPSAAGWDAVLLVLVLLFLAMFVLAFFSAVGYSIFYTVAHEIFNASNERQIP